MPYIQRNAQGRIDSLHRLPQPGVGEFLADDHVEVQEFVGRGPAPEKFDRLDAEFVRVIEDVIDALIVKNLVNITDLPTGAQAKLFARKNFREKMADNSLQLYFYDTISFEEVAQDTTYSDEL